jgi:hypothetical protein
MTSGYQRFRNLQWSENVGVQTVSLVLEQDVVR